MIRTFFQARPVSALMACGLLVLLGLAGAYRLPVALLPVTEKPALSVEVRYPGTGPVKIEELITRPLEENLAQAGEIEQVYSTSDEGLARINIEFKAGADIDRRALEVREKIDPVIQNFPREVQPPVIVRYDPSREPVFIATLETENMPPAEQRDFAERDVKKALEAVRGVGEVLVAGGSEREILVACDKTATEAHGLALGEILESVQRANVSRALGELDAPGGRFALTQKGRFRELRDIEQLPLFARDGRVVRLGTVATVTRALRDTDSASRLNGAERVSIFVFRAARASLPQLSSALRARLHDLERPDLTFAVRHDRAESILSAFRYTALALVFALALSGAVLRFLFAFSRRQVLSVLVLAPGAVLSASFLLFLSGAQYDLMTIAGLCLGAGPVLYFGTAAIRGDPGARGLAFVTLILSAGFVPVLFAGPDVRVLYGPVALSLTCTLLSGLFLIQAGLPVIAGGPGAGPVLSEIWRRRIELVRDFLTVTVPAECARLADRYSRRTIFAAGIFVLVLAGLALRHSRFEFVNVFDRRVLTASLEFPSGTAFGATNDGSKKVELALIGQPGVAEITSRVEEARSTLRIKLDSDASDAFIDELKARAGRTDPAFLYFTRDGSAGALEEIEVDVFGDDLDELDRITRGLVGAAEKIEGVHDVVLRYKSPRPELRLMVESERAQGSGVAVENIGENVRLAIQGGVATRLVSLGEAREFDVRVRYDEKWRRSLENIREYGVKRAAGRFVPLFELVRPEEGQVPPRIYRKDKKRVFSFSLKGRGLAPATLLERLGQLETVPLPEGYRIEFGDGVRRYLAARTRLLLVLGLGAVFVYMVLAGFLESLRRPSGLLIFVPLPVAVALILNFLLGLALSVPVFIGIFLLTALITQQARQPVVAGEGVPGALLLVVFYLPLCFVFAPGGEVLRAFALVLVVGQGLTPLAFRNRL